MKNRIISTVLCVIMLVTLLPLSVFALDSDDIVILYETDVHCSIEGYSKLSALKKELLQTYAHVGVVSGGDFIQGNSLGAISQGEYAVKVMNLVGYDAVTLGNPEFDFRINRLNELVTMMDTKPICCNFQEVGEEDTYFEPYTIVSYGDIDVAYIGITTPSTVTSAAPAQFKDENGNYLYTFNPTELYDIVQSNIDAAEAAGADYIIAVSHIGYADDAIYGDMEDVEDLIRNTDGFDVVLDGHAHVTIESKKMTDKGGNEVLLTSTGTKFEYIGKLTISDGEMTSELIKTADLTATDPAVDAYIEQVYSEYSVLADRKIASSEVDLRVQDADGNRLVRRAETNLGDLCAEAFRYAVDADIGYINGGAIRSNILAGDISYNTMLNVMPFNNTVVLAEITGQILKDFLEMTMLKYPDENGAFPHVSGVTFSVNTAIKSSVQLDEFEEFVGVSGEYRVYDIKVFNRESGKYEPLVLEKTYTLGASNFILVDCGSGLKMLEGAKILQNDGILDVEAMERYISEALGGVVGEEYAEATPNITFTDGVVTEPDDGGDTPTDEPSNTPSDTPSEGGGNAGEQEPSDGSGDKDDGEEMSFAWEFFVIAGIILVAVLAWLFIKNKKTKTKF